MIVLLVAIGSFFSLAAGLAAGLITANEYLQGQKPDKRLALKMAVKTGLVAFAAFTVLTAGIGFVLSKIL